MNMNHQMNGLETATKIRERYRMKNVMQPRIILVTADDNLDKHRIWSHEVDEYAGKPIEYKALVEIINEIIVFVAE